jgi:hypothetical protein
MMHGQQYIKIFGGHDFDKQTDVNTSRCLSTDVLCLAHVLIVQAAGYFGSFTHTLSRITEFASWEINKAS